METERCGLDPPHPHTRAPRSFFMLLLWLVNLALSADNPKKPYALYNMVGVEHRERPAAPMVPRCCLPT